MDRVNGANYIDIGGGRRGFKSQNAAAGIAGTELTSKIMNDIQEEICAVIENSGLELDPENQQQLWEALQGIVAPGFANRAAWLPVISMTTTAPPNDAVLGDAYVIPAGATGAWANNQQKLAEWTGSSWRIVETKDGHGIGLPDGKVFIRINGVYVEWLASRTWVESRKVPVAQLSLTPWVPVKSMTVTAPPASPAAWDIYVIPAGATGAWAGHAQKLAEWNGTAWNIITPPDGHGVSLPDGRVFERVDGTYIEKLALDAQSGKWNYAEAAGTANIITATLNPALIAYTAGLRINIKIASTNTGAVTLNINGLGAKEVVDRVGTSLSAGDLTLGEIVSVIYDGTRFRTVSLSQKSNQLISSSGYVKLEGGVIMQWGGFTGNTNAGNAGGVYESGSIPITWPIAFPNTIFQCVAGCGTDVVGTGLQEQAWFLSTTKTGGTALVACRSQNVSLSGSYIVFGY
ncbi:DUF2793 domain-containing protein [Brucella anthropi]|uniref:DUF2793 domain-containing protein n=1 Tax=Brucella anthropi TaxID=529 RepID=UPI00124DA2AE|nr:DUF2793 domain-containing protein [Brucella anthropi]KAB2773243.1 DUF2793 domain-containing protein [Brucella anthropi]